LDANFVISQAQELLPIPIDIYFLNDAAMTVIGSGKAFIRGG
jgi:hypothetical protein